MLRFPAFAVVITLFHLRIAVALRRDSVAEYQRVLSRL